MNTVAVTEYLKDQVSSSFYFRFFKQIIHINRKFLYFWLANRFFDTSSTIIKNKK
jgi:hypothetical protein